MPDAIIGLAPDSTGPKVRTRTRTVGANTVHEQYLLPAKEPVVINRVWVSTFRARSRAVAVGSAAAQVIFTIWNGGTNLLSCRRLACEVDTAAARPAQPSPWLRSYRITSAPTGGFVQTPVQQDTADTALSAGVVVRADVGTTGTASAPSATVSDTGPLPTTPVMAVTGLGAVGTAVPMWAQVCPRNQSNSGWVAAPLLHLMPDDNRLNAEDPMVFRPNQGLAVRLEGPSVSTTAWAEADWTLMFKAVLAEFNYL